MILENKKKIFIYGASLSERQSLAELLAGALGCTAWSLDGEYEQTVSRSHGFVKMFQDRQTPQQIKNTLLNRYFSEATADVPEVIALDDDCLCDKKILDSCRHCGKVFFLESQSEKNVENPDLAAHYALFTKRIIRYYLVNDSLVLVGTGIAQFIRSWYPTVFDSNVAELYPNFSSNLLARIPSGENHKTPETVMALWHALAEAGLGRKDCIAAFGGGVTGDLTGFAAATWMRGMNWVNVPTTLLAMVDASTGGKTGCDLPEGKNLVGAFHSPRLVIIDIDYLKTLPEQELRNGRSEMIKHCIIGMDTKTMPLPSLAGIPSALEIADSLAVKVNIVNKDPLETKGKRILLNCGHTIGHALEVATDFALSHGEAVAIGCVEEARMAVKRGLASQDWPETLAAVFRQAGLPVALPDGLDFNTLVPMLKHDKKVNGNSVVFALPCGWGEVRPVEYQL